MRDFLQRAWEVVVSTYLVIAIISMMVHVWSNPFDDRSVIMMLLTGLGWPYYLPHFFGMI